MRVCSICNEIEIEEHAFSNGLCGVCGAKQAADDPHPDFGESGEHVHTYGEWVTLTPASCGTAGRRVRYCSGCGTLQSVAIPALAHDFGEWEAEEPSSCDLNGDALSAARRARVRRMDNGAIRSLRTRRH